MLTIKVIGEDGWSNGAELHPKGKLLELECALDRIQPQIDAGLLELVKAVEAKAVDPDEATQSLVDKVAKAFAEMTKLNARDTSITVHDRSVDDPKGGFKSFADFAMHVRKADSPDTGNSPHVKKLREYDKKTAGHMAEGDPSQGGHLVPLQFSNTLLQTSLEETIVRKRATFVPMATNQIQFPAVSDYSHAESGVGLFGGIKIYRPGEADAKTASKPIFDSVTLTLHKLVALTYASDRMQFVARSRKAA